MTLAQLTDRPVGLLPPRAQLEGALLGLLRNSLYGLPKETDFPVTNYKPKLSLDYVTQPTVAVGVDRYGTYAGGGIAAIWSDMLGYHTLVTMAQTDNQLTDSYVMVGYQNSKSRLNWGLVGQRVPYMYGSYNVYYDEIDNYPVYVQDEYLDRQINYEIGGFAYYPLNTFRRLEFSAGFDYIDFSRHVYRYIYDAYYYELIDYYNFSLPSAPSIKYGYVSAALVYDSSIFGACSPIIGKSYVLQAEPTFGNLNFVSVLADFRRYFVPVKPFTLAFRVLHYGRYGSVQMMNGSGLYILVMRTLFAAMIIVHLSTAKCNAYLITLCDGEPSTAAVVLAIGSDVGTGNAEICLVTANSSK